MKPKINSTLAISIFFAFAGSARAAVVTKATTGADLGVAAAWGAALPTTSDVATWSGTSLGGTLTDSAVQIWGALAISGTATFNVTPTVSVDPTGLVSGTSYPLLVVGGAPPSSNVPTTATVGRSLTGTLAWGTGSPFSANTLVLTVTGTSSAL